MTSYDQPSLYCRSTRKNFPDALTLYLGKSFGPKPQLKYKMSLELFNTAGSDGADLNFFLIGKC
jgi:hypothetical protein